jgi:hypothetical protein
MQFIVVMMGGNFCADDCAAAEGCDARMLIAVLLPGQ